MSNQPSDQLIGYKLDICLVAPPKVVPHRGPAFLALGGFIFLMGAAVPTLIGNIPLNEALAPMLTDAPQAHEFWSNFINDWLFFNHIRLAAGTVAALCFSYAAFNVQNRGFQL